MRRFDVKENILCEVAILKNGGLFDPEQVKWAIIREMQEREVALERGRAVHDYKVETFFEIAPAKKVSNKLLKSHEQLDFAERELKFMRGLYDLHSKENFMNNKAIIKSIDSPSLSNERIAYTTDEVSKMIGLPRTWVNYLINAGEIAHVKVSDRRKLILKKDLEKFLTDRRKPA